MTFLIKYNRFSEPLSLVYQTFDSDSLMERIVKLKIIRIENQVITCELEDGTLLDIARRWLAEDIQVDDTIEFDVIDKK